MTSYGYTGRFIDQLDGWTPGAFYDPPQAALDTIALALPLPRSVAACIIKYDGWQRRAHDLAVLLDEHQPRWDAAAFIRCEVVKGLALTGLRAKSPADVAARIRFAGRDGPLSDDVVEAVLLDLDAMAVKRRW